MKKILNKVLVGLMVLMLLVHVLILFRVIPYSIVWGGQIKDSASLLKYESLALGVLLIFTIIILLKIKFLKVGKSSRFVNLGVWVVCGYFVLNTLGNIASGVAFEQFIFAPLTIILAILTFILAK